jgi:DNA repair protein RecO (recombination protein O)
MASARGVSLTAFVLHQYDWSESSLIVDLFTREQGRLIVAARGAKKPHSNFRAVLLPFQRLSIGLATGTADAEVQNLRSAEFAGGPPMPRGGALLAGFYCNELLLKLLARHDAHARLFDAYAHTLPWLATADLQVQAALRAFELVALREVGLLPALGVDTTTQQPVLSADRYALRPEFGVVATGNEAMALGGATLLALQAALETDDLAPLHTACLTDLGALKTQVRALLNYHLGTSMLRTRQLMIELHPYTA